MPQQQKKQRVGNQVVAIYEVVLMPDADTRYDPFTVTLSWNEHEAPKDWRTDPEVLDEAFERAVTVQRQEADTADDAEFQNGGVRFERERLVHASKAR